MPGDTETVTEPNRIDHLGRTLPRVVLWTEQGTGAFNSWNDFVELARRADGTFSLRFRCRGIEEPYVVTVYRSRPFRTPRRLLDEIQRRLPEAVRGNLNRPFTLSDTLLMLAELTGFDGDLAQEALRILARQVEEAQTRSGFDPKLLA